jgi:hypothetical protein
MRKMRNVDELLVLQIFPVQQDSGAKTSNSSTSAEKIARLVFGYRVVNGALCYCIIIGDNLLFPTMNFI